MKDKKHTMTIGSNKVEIEKIYRTKTQFEWFLTIYMGNSNVQSIHAYNECHLTKKAAINEAKKAIATKPRIERIS